MDKLLKKVNKLQDIFCELGLSSDLNLPRIAVIGGQSVGKSSVLESFVGRDFLPRGSGIVTRTPLILHLNNTSGRDGVEYGEFLHAKGKRYTNFLEIRDEITSETDRTTEKGNISEKEIVLNIYSPNVVNITLIDLPGMVRLSVGDQSRNIKDQVRKLNRKYIENEETIILAVSSANTDLATSDALSLAKSVDPIGNRTIGVLTKLDLMDKGTDARNVLENKVIPLKKGYVGVCNRSQKDIDSKKDITHARKDENNFLRNHPSYKTISGRLGSEYLQEYLSEILNTALIKALPDIRRNIEIARKSVQREIDTFPKVHLNSEEKYKDLHNLLKNMEEKFSRNIIGGVLDVPTNSTSFGAKIKRIINEEYQNNMLVIDEDKEFMKRIKLAIENTHGYKLGNFTPDLAIETIVREEIEKFRDISENCIVDVIFEVKLTLEDILDVYEGLPILREAVHEKAGQHVIELNVNAIKKLEYFIEFEKSYFNSLHKDFVKSQRLNCGGVLKVLGVSEGLKLSLEPHLSASDKFVYLCVEGENVFIYKGKFPSMGKILLTFPKFSCKATMNANGFTLEYFKFDNNNNTSMNGVQNFFQFGQQNNKIEFSWDVSSENGYLAENRSIKWKSIFCKDIFEMMSTQTEMAYQSIHSYMEIVKTTFCDFMPKLVSLEVIKQFETFLKRDLPLTFSNDQDQIDTLFKQSAEDEKRLDELRRKEIAYVKSMKILREINTTCL